MTLKEQLYRFENLDIHGAIIMQQALESRMMNITNEKSEALKLPEKALKAVLDELAQQFDDLDRHLASIIRRQEYQEKVKALEEMEKHISPSRSGQ
jgi:replicative DNA helicase